MFRGTVNFRKTIYFKVLLKVYWTASMISSIIINFSPSKVFPYSSSLEFRDPTCPLTSSNFSFNDSQDLLDFASFSFKVLIQPDRVSTSFFHCFFTFFKASLVVDKSFSKEKLEDYVESLIVFRSFSMRSILDYNFISLVQDYLFELNMELVRFTTLCK